ncbi:COX7a domain containing protein, partial [Asbolus verrucosus]
KTVSLARTLFREFSKTTPVQSTEVVTPKFHKLKEAQKKFGIEDNVPVHLKGGVTDKLLYQLTILVTLTGVGLSFETFYRLINK